MKKCTKCQPEKPFAEFSKDKTKKDGLQHMCKKCTKIVKKKYYDENKEYFVEYDLQNKYGLSIEQKNSMALKQNNECYLCHITLEEHFERYNKSFAVDHDHITGQIRKLLCSSCNTAIGSMKDDSSLLRRAADYIDHFKAQPLDQSNVIPLKR